MEKEISAGAIIFRRKGKKNEYLLLKHEIFRHKDEYWNFPKGHIEKGESEIEAAKREIFEEAGIKVLKFIPGFRFSETYFLRRKGAKKTVLKTVVWYVAGVSKNARPKISSEHEDFGWFYFANAYKKLKYPAQKHTLIRAEKFLKIIGLHAGAQKLFVLVKKIPEGKVMAYSALAKKIGVPQGARWAGFVLNKNTDPSIPCHRVIMANGLIGGYNKGVRKKSLILRREGIKICGGKIDLKQYGWET